VAASIVKVDVGDGWGAAKAATDVAKNMRGVSKELRRDFMIESGR
jgi:hypothetical protein